MLNLVKVCILLKVSFEIELKIGLYDGYSFVKPISSSNKCFSAKLFYIVLDKAYRYNKSGSHNNYYCM